MWANLGHIRSFTENILHCNLVSTVVEKSMSVPFKDMNVLYQLILKYNFKITVDHQHFAGLHVYILVLLNF